MSGGHDAAGAPADPVVRQLLRNALALQIEDLLRTVGAMAQQQRDVREWSFLVEHDVRDLCLLTSHAVSAGASLPAGLDAGGGDPDDPDSVLDGLLASHEALTDVLTQIAARASDHNLVHVVTGVLDRREEEAEVLRGLGARRGLPDSEWLVQGALPKFQT